MGMRINLDLLCASQESSLLHYLSNPGEFYFYIYCGGTFQAWLSSSLQRCSENYAVLGIKPSLADCKGYAQLIEYNP